MSADAVELFPTLAVLSECTAKIDPVCADGGCSKDLISKFIGGDGFKAAGGGFENMRGPLVGPGVDPVAGNDGRGGKALADPCLPFFFPGCRFPSIADSPVGDRIEAAAEGHHRGNVGSDRFFPHNLSRLPGIDTDCKIVGIAATGKDEITGGHHGSHALGGGCPG